MKILIDPGHGGVNPGAVYGGVYEKDINLSISHKLIRKLLHIGHHAECSRVCDTNLSLYQRVAIQKQHAFDMFVSVNCDAYTTDAANGFTVYHYPYSREGISLADRIQNRMSELSIKSRGVNEASYYILRETTCTAVLVECGFLSNESDRGKLINNEYQGAIASAIALGINDFCLYKESQVWP